ncbi:MAG: cupin domain-containing protein [Ardenticatenia bacterium]|nr:cupin domain-containing protein [Ardenticatenia bacterium]
MGEFPFFVPDVGAAVGDSIPPDSIVSRTLYRAGRTRAVLFGMAKGQELTEHTTPYRAHLFFVRGRARVQVAGEMFDCRGGAWLVLPPNAPHSVEAQEETLFVLIMVNEAPEGHSEGDISRPPTR